MRSICASRRGGVTARHSYAIRNGDIGTAVGAHHHIDVGVAACCIQCTRQRGLGISPRRAVAGITARRFYKQDSLRKYSGETGG